MKDLTKGNVYKTFLLFAIPMVLAGLLSQAYSFVDTVIAGKYLGEQGLAAIGATAALITFFSSIFWGYGNGFGILIARLFGSGDYKAIKTTLCNTYALLSALMLTISVLLCVFSGAIMDFLQVDPSIRADAETYFRICILGSIFTVLSTTGVYILNAFGSSTFPFLMSMLASVLNIGGNLLLVKPLGIAGLAYATVFAYLIVVICYVIKIARCFKEMGVAKEPIEWGLHTLTFTYRYALPTTLQQSVMYFSSFLLSPIVNGISSAASACYTVVLRITNINNSIFQSASKTLGNYTAQCLGAGRQDKIKKGLTVSVLQSLMFTLPVLLACVLFPKQICSLFFKEGVGSLAYDYSVQFLRFFLPLILFNLIANQFHSFFRGIVAMKSLFIATCLGSVVRILTSLILAPSLDIYGIFAGWVLSWVADGLFGFLLYWFKYRRRLIDGTELTK